jgi:glyoxylate reductase
MKHKVILAHRYDSAAVSELEQDFELVIAAGDLRQCVAANPDAIALISFLSDPVDRRLLELLPRLRVVANYAVGYNNIDIAYAASRQIAVCHTPDILTAATAEIALALMLTVCRRIIPAHDFMVAGKFRGWQHDLFLGKDLEGARLGIVGLGRIGLATALRAQPLGMKVGYYSRTRKPELEKRHGLVYQTFIDLLRKSDLISLHIPFSDDLLHLFNSDTFALMKHNSVFINVARGKLMDENALCDNLESGHLFGAGLDVYENEPLMNPRLGKMPNVVLLPHIGSAAENVRREMALMTVRSVRAALQDARPPYLIPELS